MGARCQSGALAVSSAPRNSTGVLVVGDSNTVWSGTPLPLDLAPLSAPTCFLHASLDSLYGASSSFLGIYATSIAVPADPIILGVHAYLQLFMSDSTANAFGMVASNGLTAVVGN